jgi:hypothetical protein
VRLDLEIRSTPLTRWSYCGIIELVKIRPNPRHCACSLLPPRSGDGIRCNFVQDCVDYLLRLLGKRGSGLPVGPIRLALQQ